MTRTNLMAAATVAVVMAASVATPSEGTIQLIDFTTVSNTITTCADAKTATPIVDFPMFIAGKCQPSSAVTSYFGDCDNNQLVMYTNNNCQTSSSAPPVGSPIPGPPVPAPPPVPSSVNLTLGCGGLAGGVTSFFQCKSFKKTDIVSLNVVTDCANPSGSIAFSYFLPVNQCYNPVDTTGTGLAFSFKLVPKNSGNDLVISATTYSDGTCTTQESSVDVTIPSGQETACAASSGSGRRLQGSGAGTSVSLFSSVSDFKSANGLSGAPAPSPTSPSSPTAAGAPTTSAGTPTAPTAPTTSAGTPTKSGAAGFGASGVAAAIGAVLAWVVA